jgi:hypothetical protein
VYPQRLAGFQSLSVSSLRDTESASTWLGRITGGDGSEGADGRAAGGANGRAAGGAGDEAAGGRGAAGDPPPRPDQPPSGHGGAGGRRMSRRQRRIQAWEFAKPIKIKEPKKFCGKPREDFDTWWVFVQDHIEDERERCPKDERTINWIGSFMDSYAASWHIQWLNGTLAGTHLKSMTGYVNALKLRFQDQGTKDEAYEDLEKVQYKGCIREMFTQIPTFNNKAMVSRAALKKLILERRPQKIIEQMHTVDLTGKTDQEILTIISNAAQTAEKWEAARKILGLKASLKLYDRKFSKNERSDGRDTLNKYAQKNYCTDNLRLERKIFKNDGSQPNSKKGYEKAEAIESSEIEQRKTAWECLRCAWPGDRKGNYRVNNCIRPIKLNKGTAS